MRSLRGHLLELLTVIVASSKNVKTWRLSETQEGPTEFLFAPSRERPYIVNMPFPVLRPATYVMSCLRRVTYGEECTGHAVIRVDVGCTCVNLYCSLCSPQRLL